MRERCAFSLIELLVVISIIAVLAGMLLPAVGVVRQQARTLTCASSQRQVGMAIFAYTSDHDGLIPDIATKMSASASTYRWAELIADYAEAATAGGGVAYTKKTVLTGCPEWTSTGAWLLGYGMNYNPDRPTRWNACSRWVYSDLPNPDVVHFALAGISHKSSRLLIADAYDYHAMISLNRHKDRFNVLFFDGHIQALRGAAAATQIKDHPELGVP